MPRERGTTVRDAGVRFAVQNGGRVNTITIRAADGRQKINKHIYGHFAEHLGRCIYDGIWVGEDSPIPNVRGIRTDIVEALKRLNAPNLRWPGGCFADVYDWRQGIGPKDKRPSIINIWGNALENNHFGTHEFMDLCEQIGCDPYIGGNVGSGNVREMRDWLEYLTSDDRSALADERRRNGREKAWGIPFWGIGNENWGCGGNMTPVYYADLYCQYQNFIRNHNAAVPMMKIASGYGGSDTEGRDLAVFMEHITKRHFPVKTDGISVHYYVYLRENQRHSATQFGEEEWFEVIRLGHRIGHVIEQNAKILDSYDPDKRMWLIIDEWGTWYPNEPGTPRDFLYQQNSMRDAVVAADSLHLFQQYADRVQMANIAQTVNVLQAMILTQGEQMILTPTYYVFEMFKAHQDATLLPLDIDATPYSMGEHSVPSISASASRGANGDVLLTLANMTPRESQTIRVNGVGAAASIASATLLAGDDMTAHNTFEQPERVTPTAFTGAAISDDGTLTIELPAASVAAITLRGL